MSRNNEVAVAALGCFQSEAECATKTAPYVTALQNLLPTLVRHTSEDVRVQAVRLLADFPGEFAEKALRERAADDSAKVRSVVADVIGDGKFRRVLPTLVKLFSDPVGRDQLVPPLTMEMLRAGRRWNNIGDVHTSAGLALVKFDLEQVSDILKSNLNDPGFHINFVAKLAEKDAGPWLSELAEILETRRKDIETIAKAGPLGSRKFTEPMPDRILIGTYAKCWEDIRQYLLNLPKEKLLTSEMEHYMDLLEKTVQKSSVRVKEACHLYELYQTKRLEERAKAIRLHYPNEGWWFDEFDRNHPNL